METAQSVRPLTAEEYRSYFTNGINYPQYLQAMQANLENGPTDDHSQYLPMNWQRMSRLNKTVKLTDETRAALAGLTRPLHWLVITEHWCGDASQIMPVLNSIAEASNGAIQLRMVYRDEHPELIDNHLTGIARAIPKLIQLDENFQVMSTWGPRPAAAQALVIQVKADPATAPKYSEHLHKWYALDKTMTVQEELVAMLQG